MTSTKLTMRLEDGKYVYDFTASTSKICIAANYTHMCRLGAYLVDDKLVNKVPIGFDQGTDPVLFMNLMVGQKIRIVSEMEPKAIVMQEN